MVNKPYLFSVIHFDIDGFLKLSNDQMKSGGFQYLLQKNQIEFDIRWKVAVGIDFASLEIIALYEPTLKIDLSKLASYRATQNYIFTDISNKGNEKETIEDAVLSFHKQLSIEYDKRLQGTKIEMPFPPMGLQQLGLVGQRAISSLHKTLEMLKNFPQN